MDYQRLAEKYFLDHANPVPKPESFGQKFYNTPSNEEVNERKEKCIESLKSVLKHNRVERRMVRVTAEWSPQESVAKINKTKGFIKHFGIQNKNGTFLNSNESLFLLETNKLELSAHKIPLSIQEGFELINNFDRYLSYKKLSLQGYKLKSVKEKQKKRKLGDTAGPSPKLKKTDEGNKTVEDIFEKLRQNASKNFVCEKSSNQLPDYYVKTPNERTEFGLVIESAKEYCPKLGDPENVNIYGLCSDDEVSFYKFFNVDLPNL